ncbi:hypothetical protein QQ045_032291 [Rhodiola kirilowii]
MADNESGKKRKRVTIGVDEMYSVFWRYTPPTIITLYQEIAKFCGEKIDWREMVRRTSTGIKNAREYQMLWRHLAYRHLLENNIEDGAEPLDDDSDLETDLEATPLDSGKVVADAQACVKVILASGPTSDLSMPNNLAATAPLAANENLACAVLKGSHNVVSGPEMNSGPQILSERRPSFAHQSIDDQVATGGNPLPKKKKNVWSPEDDMVLIAGVKKWGVRNWATISREYFNGVRNAAQIGSRWKQLKDKNSLGSNSAESNEQVAAATRNALSMALNMPVTLTACSARTGSSSQFAQAMTSASLKDRAVLAKPPVSVKSSVSSNSLLQATAVAAGARIATPEAAESLLKAAHAKNAVHIMHGGAPKIKYGSFGPLPTSHRHGASSSIILGLPATTLSSSSTVVPSVLKAGSPSPIISPQSNAISSTAADKHQSSPNMNELIRSKEAVNGTCNDSQIKEQEEQVQD